MGFCPHGPCCILGTGAVSGRGTVNAGSSATSPSTPPPPTPPRQRPGAELLLLGEWSHSRTFRHKTPRSARKAASSAWSQHLPGDTVSSKRILPGLVMPRLDGRILRTLANSCMGPGCAGDLLPAREPSKQTREHAPSLSSSPPTVSGPSRPAVAGRTRTVPAWQADAPLPPLPAAVPAVPLSAHRSPPPDAQRGTGP